MNCFLGVDAGTSGVKAIVLDGSGRILGAGYAECNLITPRPGWVEQSPLDWWNACDTAITRAVAQSGRGQDVRGIGFSGQMQGCTLLDKAGTPIRDSLIWMDQRAHAEADWLNTRMEPDALLGITANLCLPSYIAPKLLWLQKHEPEAFARTTTVLFPKDYLRYRMTGELATDVTDASCSFLLDLGGRRWSDEMFRSAGLSKALMPAQLLESQQVAGELLPRHAARWGMKPGTPVVAGAGDQQAGGVGAGIIRPGVLSATIGTSGVVFGSCGMPFIDRRRRAMYSECHAVPGGYSCLGCTLGAGGSYKWLRDTLFAETKTALEQKGQNVYQYMDQLAAGIPPGCEGLTFLPYLNGESTPYVDPDARGVFFGLSYRHGLGAICRSVMEGVAYSLRDILEILREFGQTAGEVRVMGGGAKSPLWRQIQADIFGMPVVTMNMEEASAAGAAILAAVGTGHFSSVQEACGAILKPVSTVDPIPRNMAIYNEYYQGYRSLYPSLKAEFAAQARRGGGMRDIRAAE